MLLLAQASPAPASSAAQHRAVLASEAQLAQQSGAIGTILYALDRAAWVSTDALFRKMDRSKLSGPGGYVVERLGDKGLRVTYYRGKGRDATAYFVADVENEKVVRDELLPSPAPLTERQLVLAAAREAAADAAVAAGYKPCTAAPFNTVVMPSPDSPTVVYLLTAQTTNTSYPIGGHFRIVVGPDGKALASRPFSASCLSLDLPKLPAGSKPVALVTSNRLDTVPTEVFVFASHSLRLPLYVVSKDQRLWKVEGRNIELQPGGIK